MYIMFVFIDLFIHLGFLINVYFFKGDVNLDNSLLRNSGLILLQTTICRGNYVRQKGVLWTLICLDWLGKFA